MRFLWNNASRKSRQSLLWKRPSSGVVITYPFQIWEGDSSSIPTFVTSPAWDTALTGPAYKYLNLLSAPAGSTLNGLQSIGVSEPYQGMVTLPPLSASLSVTLTFSISESVISVSSPTVRAMNLGFPAFDAYNLINLDFPKWEVGSLRLSGFTSIVPTTDRFAFPEYRGAGIGVPQAAALELYDGHYNFDFPKLVELFAFDIQNSDPNTYEFTCTFPVLAKVENLNILQSIITGQGKTISLPELTEITGVGFNPLIVALDFYAPLLATIGSNGSVEFGNSSASLRNLDVALTTLNGRDVYVYLDDLSETFNLFGASVTTSHGQIWLYVNASTLAQTDAVWSAWAIALVVGGATSLNAPAPTGGLLNADVVTLLSRGYTISFT